MAQCSNQLETVEDFNDHQKINAEICNAWFEPKVEIKICTAFLDKENMYC
jgi:hypothetical protein